MLTGDDVNRRLSRLKKKQREHEVEGGKYARDNLLEKKSDLPCKDRITTIARTHTLTNTTPKMTTAYTFTQDMLANFA